MRHNNKSKFLASSSAIVLLLLLIAAIAVNGIGLPAKQEAFAAPMPDFNIGAAGDCGRESQTRNTARGSVNLTAHRGIF